MFLILRTGSGVGFATGDHDNRLALESCDEIAVGPHSATSPARTLFGRSRGFSGDFVQEDLCLMNDISLLSEDFFLQNLILRTFFILFLTHVTFNTLNSTSSPRILDSLLCCSMNAREEKRIFACLVRI